ncbi:hypothetical protein AQ914_04625 [Burkholderia pseudomallei]|uniref:winged helix-turn-helix domain-containing protein n=1 Tax=Burkholderia pseudomallei TaxID=28450 RepID=UPI0009756662|nr:hypothetical protein [Burkholderia pseudomallei]ONC26370.1 hypothetical protein AQ914_04625 [Burkholderia pseudomallei]
MEYCFESCGVLFTFDPETRIIANASEARQRYLSKNESLALASLIHGAQTKEHLMQQVWFGRGLVVTDASYYQLVAHVRKAFAAIGLPKQTLKTIPRYGLELDVTPANPVTATDIEDVNSDGAMSVLHRQPQAEPHLALNTRDAVTPFVRSRTVSVWKRFSGAVARRCAKVAVFVTVAFAGFSVQHFVLASTTHHMPEHGALGRTAH